jgi:hypothetical protein
MSERARASAQAWVPGPRSTEWSVFDRLTACLSCKSIAIVAFTALVMFAGEAAVQEIRTVPHRYAVPLSKQVACPRKERIQLTAEPHGSVLVGELTAEGYIDTALDLSDVTVVFLADDVKSVLTENDSWISTRVSGFVEEVMSSRKLKPARYSRVALQLRDGTMSINGCEVTTGTPAQIEAGRRYLVFFSQPSGPYAVPTVDPFGFAKTVASKVQQCRLCTMPVWRWSAKGYGLRQVVDVFS